MRSEGVDHDAAGRFVERVFGKLHDFEGLVVQVLLVAHGSLLRSGKQESLAEKMIASLGATVSTTERTHHPGNERGTDFDRAQKLLNAYTRGGLRALTAKEGS